MAVFVKYMSVAWNQFKSDIIDTIKIWEEAKYKFSPKFFYIKIYWWLPSWISDHLKIPLYIWKLIKKNNQICWKAYLCQADMQKTIKD